MNQESFREHTETFHKLPISFLPNKVPNFKHPESFYELTESFWMLIESFYKLTETFWIRRNSFCIGKYSFQLVDKRIYKRKESFPPWNETNIKKNITTAETLVLQLQKKRDDLLASFSCTATPENNGGVGYGSVSLRTPGITYN
jgi:hypothetical protein